MAISTYSELQAAAANWLIRADQTASIPTMIVLAETRLNRVLRERQAEMDIALTTVAGSRTVALPALYSEGLNAWIMLPNGSQRIGLRFVDPAALDVSTVRGQPLAWTIDGANLAFERPCDQAYAITLRGIEKYALSDASPTNTLLSDYPDAYLFATLCEAGAMLRDADLTNAYEAKLTRSIAEINAKDARSRAQQTLSTEPGQLTFAGRRSGYNIYGDRFA
jgi:hypothetical protein